MALGGVPHYLEKVLPGESVAQALDRLCFSKDGFLRTEFDNVFASLFDQHDNHEAIIKTLASVRKGLTRNELLAKSRINSGGTLTKTEYSMFYIKYIENTKPSKSGVWNKMYGQQSFKIWSGFSFETICMKHVDQIKEGLKISGIHSVHGSWIEKNSPNSAQIDLLIDRDDNVINLCEMKFYNSEYAIDKKYATEIAKKVNAFS